MRAAAIEVWDRSHRPHFTQLRLQRDAQRVPVVYDCLELQGDRNLNKTNEGTLGIREIDKRPLFAIGANIKSGSI